MKTAILQLEPYDNQFSICDRMEWGHALRILLVWPKRERLLENELELQVIQRQAVKQGAQIALICRDPKVIENAEHLNISVFSSVPAAESSRWKTNRGYFNKIVNSDFIRSLQIKEFLKPKPQPSKNVVDLRRGIAIFLGALAIISLVLYLVPSAKVILFPQTEEKQITLSIWASPQVKEINLNGNLPAVRKEIEVSDKLQGQSSGTTGIPSEFATGEVTFNNLSREPVVVPKDTVVSTASDPVVRFQTASEITVPAGRVSNESVAVQALQAGVSGNLGESALTVVEGSLGVKLAVTNELPTSGGIDQLAPSPTDQDYEKLKSELLNRLRQKAAAEIETVDEKLIDGSLNSGTITSEVHLLEPGTPGEQFALTLSVRFSGLVYSESDLQLLARQAMTVSLISTNGENYSGEVKLSMKSSDIEFSEDGARWQETASALVGQKVDVNKLTQAIAGKKISDARQFLLANLPSRANPVISVFPPGWNWLPFAGYQIQIQAQ